MRRLQAFIAAGSGPVLVLIGSIAITPTVLAQDDDDVLDVITVTAQKRSEALSDVPMSITVLGGETLERQQIYNFEDLVTLVPGLSINTNTRGISRITLRGTNTGGVASTVGVYVDEVPFGSSSGLANAAVLSGDFDTFDLARIEVLRGPQGTLYGASSLGGVMRYITNSASTEAFETRGQVSAESVEDGGTGYAVTGLVNIPFGDNFAVRASGFYRSDDGWIDTIGNNPIPSLTDPMNPAVAGTRVAEDINTVDVFGGRVSALIDFSDAVSLDLRALAQNIESESSNIVDADSSTLEPLNSAPVKSQYHVDFDDIEYRLYSATLDWDFGTVALQSITSYSTFEQTLRDDLAANTALTGGVPLASVVTLFFGDPVAQPLSSFLDQITSTDKFTQELRLISDESDTFEWLVGLYYTDEESGINPQQILAAESGTDMIASGIPVLAEALLDSQYEEIALFANATWHISPNFDLSFGARQSDNDQSASQVLTGPLVGGSVSFDDSQSSESPFTWSISPRWELSDGVSVFARIATGFRPGGPNVIPTGAPPGTPGSYDSDEITSYELGLKADSPGGMFSLDLTGYFLDWEDVQLLAVVNGVGLNANGGTAESKGFEFAATARPTDGLTLAFNWAYTDAYLTQDTDPIVGGMDGDPLGYVPEWSFGFNADYTWALAGDSTAYVGGGIGYVGDRPADLGNRDSGGSIREVDAYSTIDLRGGVDFGQWYVEVYGKNLTDEEGINDLIDSGTLPNGAVGLGLIRPRTYGLSVGLRY